MSNRPEVYERLIDYAGVFPPAALALGDAVADYEAAAGGPHRWMLGPFLLRVSQAAELPEAALAALDGRLGLVADRPVAELVWSRLGPGAAPAVVQVEAAVDPDGFDAEDAKRLAGGAPVLYLESADPARAADLAVTVATLRGAVGGIEVRAKIRTGGATPAHFPDPDELAAFVVACATHHVPFKATAGLHEPFRHASTVVDGATEHGFVNLLAAARAAAAGEDEAVAAALADTDPSAFDASTGAWKEVGAGVPAGDVRALLCSYGSCSFTEPVEHLVALGVLEGGSGDGGGSAR